MFLNVINPVGIASSVDLVGLPLWRIELARWNAPGDVTKNPVLGLILRYVIGAATVDGAGRTVTQMIQLAGIDTGTSGDELMEAVSRGLPHADRAENRETLRESLGMLHNAVDKASEANDIITRALGLVDLRHDLLEALWQRGASDLLAMGPRWAASYEGYRCALVANRFDPWLGAPVKATALSPLPGEQPVAAARKGKSKGASEGPPAAVL